MMKKDNPMIRKNTTKEKLRAGQTVIGCRMDFESPYIVETIGNAGFDFVYYDCEHGPMSVDSCGQMVRAAELSGLTPIVRVATNEPGVILRYLDTGVMGIIVPHCDSKEAAQAAVEAVKYPPEGDRGMGGRLQSLSGMTVADYVKEVNKETMVIVMIEDPQGVKNFTEILEVEGIDVFLVGRLDLSVSLGVAGQVEHPSIKEAVDKVLTSARKAGKAVGVGAIDVGKPERVRQFIDQGAQLFPLNTINIFNNAAKELLQKIVKGT